MKMVAKTEYTDYLCTPSRALHTHLYFLRNVKIFEAERKKLFGISVFIIFSILFWAFFEQSGGSLSLFAAGNLNDTVLGIKLDPNGVNNAANSLFVIIFAPILGLLWVWMRTHMLPNTVVKFGFGFLFLALAFYVFYATRFFANEQGITSLDVFTLAYFVIHFRELRLSPIGLSIMTKLSPQAFAGRNDGHAVFS